MFISSAPGKVWAYKVIQLTNSLYTSTGNNRRLTTGATVYYLFNKSTIQKTNERLIKCLATSLMILCLAI